jgi:hypothetical protein
MTPGNADDQRRARRVLAAPASALAAALLAGCAAQAPERRALAPQFVERATVGGISDLRYWADSPPPSLERWLQLPDDQLQAMYPALVDQPHAYLVISGGGSDGAFGAGLLAGWTDTGTRPEFQIVTGVSTGALIAPFAFLGSDYDARLRELYTSFSTRELIRKRGLLESLRGDSLFDSTPMRRLLERYVGDTEIERIAAAARRGRTLLIGTTNLDAARAMIWDVTRIATRGGPAAKRLIHDVMLASASVPGAFPPVLIEVEHGGERYAEMHVDGGATAQLFFGPDGLDWRRVEQRFRVRGQPQVYVIRNARLIQDFERVERKLAPIFMRTVASLIRTQGVGDLARVYIATQRAGIGFNLARVPPEFDRKSAEPFDREYMRALFERGYAMARGGYPWIRESTP